MKEATQICLSALMLVAITTPSPGREIRLTQRRLMNRVTHCVPPALPIGGTLRLNGKVTVEVRVNERGLVEGVKVIQGHPLLRGSVLEAVRSWKFRPFVSHSTPIGAVGRL